MDDNGQSDSVAGSQDGDDIRRAMKEWKNRDRAEAIVHTTMLELLVRERLAKAFKVHGKHEKGLIGGTNSTGVLGFSDQCLLLYCLGVITDLEHHDLDLIARIRNRFAHRLNCDSFQEEGIKCMCRELHLPENGAHRFRADQLASASEPRDRFSLSVLALTFGSLISSPGLVYSAETKKQR